MSGFNGYIQLVYVLVAAMFVVGLHLMNSPATARRGNQVALTGMGIAVIATLILMIHYGTVASTIQPVVVTVPLWISRTNVAMTAITMPTWATWLPRRAVAGLFIRCRPITNMAATST